MALRACALALGLSLTAGGSAFASGFFSFAAASLTPVTGPAGLDVNEGHGFQSAQVFSPLDQLDSAEAFTNDFAFGGLLSTDVRGSFFEDHFQIPSDGSGSLISTSIANLTDRLTLQGDPGDQRTVTLRGHYVMTDQSGAAIDHGSGNFSLQMHSTVELDGGGIQGPADRIFFLNDLENDGHGVSGERLGPPPSIDFSLTFVLGQPQDFSLTMTAVGQENITNHNDNTFGNFLTHDDLNIDPNFEFTDSSGAAITCGLRLFSETGVFFDRLPSCDAGGGGGGGGGGAGGVPEPQAWALMVGGFGVVGAALRSRRALRNRQMVTGA
jgi:hypothetical protein